MKKLSVLLLVCVMMLSMLAACGGSSSTTTTDPKEGPIYDDYSEMTDEQLYEAAKKEGGQINLYATSSGMLKEEEPFEKAYPGLDLVVTDLSQDEVLDKCKIEAKSGNITGDVLQAKDVNGQVFYDFYEAGYCSAFYPKDICANIDTGLMKYGYPLYTSQSMWYYNTKIFPNGQPITSWWNLLETNADGSQKYTLFTKEIGSESAYLSLFASFIVNADQMAQSYKDLYGKDLEYTYDASSFSFKVPEKNAGVEYMWRFSQLKITFNGDGDELVQAVNNSDAEHPTLALASAGKIKNRDESGYAIDWCVNLTPYTGLQNCEYLYVVSKCDNPAGARLLIRFITGGADGKSGGLKPFSKQGNWVARTDVASDWNPVASVKDIGAISPNLKSIYDQYLDTQDMWTYWLDKNPNMKG